MNAGTNRRHVLRRFFCPASLDLSTHFLDWFEAPDHFAFPARHVQYLLLRDR